MKQRIVNLCRIAAIVGIVTGVGLVVVPPELGAQDRLEVLDSCVNVEWSGNAGNMTITNNCGVRIHAHWGFYDKEADSGIMEYATDLAPGETHSGYILTKFYAVGCPYTPTLGHPYGYKLTYREKPGNTVTSWKHMNSLECIQW
jgi:hypothetical protein